MSGYLLFIVQIREREREEREREKGDFGVKSVFR